MTIEARQFNFLGITALVNASTAAEVRTAIGVEGSGGGSGGISTPNVQTGLSYTLQAGDVGDTIVVINDNENELFIPSDSEINFELGTFLYVRPEGTGKTVFRPSSPATINGLGINNANQVQTSNQNGFTRLWKRASNTWLAIDNIESVATTYVP